MQRWIGTPGHRFVFGLAFAVAFSVHLLIFSVSPMVGVLMAEMDLSHAQFGMIFSAAMISLILFRLPWGILADRRGYVGVLRLALILSALAAGLRAVSHGYAGLLVSQFVLGVGLAALMPCLSLMVKAWAAARPGLGTGIYFSGFAVGNATALGLTPLILPVCGCVSSDLCCVSASSGFCCFSWWARWVAMTRLRAGCRACCR